MKPHKSITPIILLVAFSAILSGGIGDQEGEKNLVLAKIGSDIKAGNRAIIVGINDYLSDDITDLQYCEGDAQRFAKALESQGWDSDKIRIMAGKSANYETIYETVNSTASMDKKFMPKGSTLIFFFSGHGTSVGDKLYLIPYDGTANPNLVKNKNVELEEIESTLQSSGFDVKLLFIDACRTKFGGKDVTLEEIDNFKKGATSEGMRSFLGTEEGKLAREDPNLKSGVFTEFLVKGLQNTITKCNVEGADYDRNGVVVLSELEMYIAKEMQDYSFKTGKTQRVVTRGECDPLVKLAVVGIPTPPPDPLKVKSKFFTASIELTNKKADYQYSVIPNSVDVEVQGAVSVIDGINVSEKIAYVDVSKLTEGSYQFNPQTQLGLTSLFPSQVSIVSVKQSTIKVEVKKNPVKTGKIKDVKLLRTFTSSGGVSSIAFSSDCQFITSLTFTSTRHFKDQGSDYYGIVNLWAIQSGGNIANFKFSGWPYVIAFSPDFSKGVIDLDYKTLTFFSMADGHEFKKVKEFYKTRTESISFSPDGKKIAIALAGEAPAIWSFDKAKEIARFNNSPGAKSVVFSPDGTKLASGGYDSTVKIWSADSLNCLKTIYAHSKTVSQVVFSPNGQLIASCSEDGTVKLWSVSDGNLIWSAQATDFQVDSIAFNPDGDILASGDFYDGNIKFWSVEAGECLHTIPGNAVYGSNNINDMEFSPDGRLLAASSANKIDLWQIEYK